MGLVLLAIVSSQIIDWAVLRMVSSHLLFQGISANVMGLFVYRWFPSQFPVFAFGILGFKIIQALPSFGSKQSGLMLLLICIPFLLAIAHLGTGIPQILYGLGYFLLILGLKSYSISIVVNPLVCFLGRISYSVYLLHFAVLLFLEEYLRVQSHWPLFFLTAIFTAPPAWLTYTFIEQPFIKLASSLI